MNLSFSWMEHPGNSTSFLIDPWNFYVYTMLFLPLLQTTCQPSTSPAWIVSIQEKAGFTPDMMMITETCNASINVAHASWRWHYTCIHTKSNLTFKANTTSHTQPFTLATGRNCENHTVIFFYLQCVLSAALGHCVIQFNLTFTWFVHTSY